MNGASYRTAGRFLSACLLLVALTGQAKIGVVYQMQLGDPTDAKPDRSNHEHYLIQRSVLAEDYDDERGEPNWVAWDLTADDLGPAKRTPTFHPDSELPDSFHHITSGEYKQSGFDRGHMCDSKDRTDNAQDNEMVFAMSNIIPQTKDNNEGVWEHLESYCREQAQSGNELLIICGPAGFNGDRIPNGPVLIPSHTWKIIVEVPNGPGSVLSRISSQTRVIAVDIPNIQGVRDDPWQKYVVSVNKIEALTGYRFFTTLAPDLAAVLKAKVDGHASETVAYAKAESRPNSTAGNQQPLWVPVAIVVLIVLLVLGFSVLIVFFRTKPKRRN
jgi:endonuclease G